MPTQEQPILSRWVVALPAQDSCGYCGKASEHTSGTHKPLLSSKNLPVSSTPDHGRPSILLRLVKRDCKGPKSHWQPRFFNRTEQTTGVVHENGLMVWTESMSVAPTRVRCRLGA